METIYIDSLFLINLVVDYFILLATARVCSHPLQRWRLGLAAAAGAVYSVLVVVPGFGFLATAPVKLASAVFMLLIAFGGRPRLPRTAVTFLAVSALFGGAVYAASMLGGVPMGTGTVYVPVTMRVLLLSFAICYAVVTLVFRRIGTRPERTVATVDIGFMGKTVHTSALRDTGNSLYDPVSGRKVCVVEDDAALPLFPAELRRTLKRCGSSIEFFEELSKFDGLAGRFRLIPYTAVGVSSNLLPAFRPDSLVIDGEAHGDMLVALSPTRLCEDGEYSAII